MTVLYNEIDPFPAAWLNNLISAGYIAKGKVDKRSIKKLKSKDLKNITQFHAFAGIGVWSYALKLAGWLDNREVWTGSCPCQPFSIAGKGKELKDKRHLWPIWRNLIEKCRPTTIFGEQVASPAGRLWLGIVQIDLEALGYSFGAADLCAASVGAPHIRQRLYWVGHTNSNDTRWHTRTRISTKTTSSRKRISNRSYGNSTKSSSPNDYWSMQETVLLTDGSARPFKPGIFPLADGTPSKMGRLRAYGNAIVAPLAAEFIKACKIEV